MEYLELNNRIKTPVLGLGTYKIIDTKEMKTAVFTALDTGYRLFDTAEMYANEFQLGKALKEYGIKREEVFITTKIWDSSIGYDYTIKAFEAGLERLQTDYIDLYLIHWPRGNSFLETWKAMEFLYKEGRVRAIGVSNFTESHLNYLFRHSDIIPAVNQIEIHPYYFPGSTIEFCRKNNIAVQSWSPIAKGKVSEDPVIKEIAAKYNKTPVQTVIRWHIQHNFIVIPKSANPQRIKENFDVFDFELSAEDMQAINNISKPGKLGHDPDSFLI